MGIQNLLQELKPITKFAKLSEFKGQTCGVDASCWLHRAAYSCALQLVSGKSTDKYLGFTLNCITLLKNNEITPIIVFDGAHLPMKANEEHRRNVIRNRNKKEAMKHLKSGDRENAWKCAQKAVHITKQMITGFMNQCIKHEIQFVCAPYEADSQLGYMYIRKQIDFVISEDSDLMLFGIKKALYKFDPKTTSGQFVNLDLIRNYTQPIAKKRMMDLCHFLKKFWIADPADDDAKRIRKEKEFIHVCVLSGCDYVDNLPGIGLKTAVKHCSQHRKMEYLLSNLMMCKQNKAPKDYKIQFKRAVLTFRHQTVYDIESKQQTRLNPLTESVDLYLNELKRYLARLPQRRDNNSNDNGKNPTIYDTTLDFLGKMADQHTARAMAEGRINARSLKPRNLETTNTANTIRGEHMCDHNDNIFSRRGARESTQNTSINVFGLKQKKKLKDTNIRKPTKETNSVKKSSKSSKSNKYFGRKAAKMNDSGLNELLGQFAFAKPDMHPQNTQSTQQLQQDIFHMEHKDEQENMDDMCDISSDDKTTDNQHHKPMQRRRKSRKRKRDMMEDDAALTNIKNTNNSSKRVSRRRLNHSGVQNNNEATPNIRKTIDKTPTASGWMSDLYTPSDPRCNKTKSRRNQKEDKENKRSNNPFSIKRKKRASLAMIGVEKPINSSDSEEDEVSEDLRINSKHMEANKEIYDCLDDEEEDTVKSGIYSQLSQSQSEKQMHDLVDRFHVSQSQKSEECKEDEDDDLEIIKKDVSEKKEIQKKKIQNTKPKPFKKPRFKNGIPPAIRSAKKKVKKTKNANKPKQKSITSFFKRK